VESPSPPDTATSSLTPVEGGTTSKPVGTVRLTPSLGKVSRLAVLSDYRVYGFGRELMRAAMDYARTLQDDELTKVVRSREDGATVVPLKLHSQVGFLTVVEWTKASFELSLPQLQVIPWYQKLGFKPEGELFDEDGGRCTTRLYSLRSPSDSFHSPPSEDGMRSRSGQLGIEK
jgi:GNAT superfamily N-acetyltransferase